MTEKRDMDAKPGCDINSGTAILRRLQSILNEFSVTADDYIEECVTLTPTGEIKCDCPELSSNDRAAIEEWALGQYADIDENMYRLNLDNRRIFVFSARELPDGCGILQGIILRASAGLRIAVTILQARRLSQQGAAFWTPKNQIQIC